MNFFIKTCQNAHNCTPQLGSSYWDGQHGKAVECRERYFGKTTNCKLLRLRVTECETYSKTERFYSPSSMRATWTLVYRCHQTMLSENVCSLKEAQKIPGTQYYRLTHKISNETAEQKLSNFTFYFGNKENALNTKVKQLTVAFITVQYLASRFANMRNRRQLKDFAKNIHTRDRPNVC